MNVSEALPVAPVVNFITGNANKLREVKEILEPAVRVDNKELDIEEIQGSIEEIAIAKCRKAADLVRIRPLSKLCLMYTVHGLGSGKALTIRLAEWAGAGRGHRPLLRGPEWTSRPLHVS